ncbi:hypothetical protein E3J61_01415 [Candidatus Dependentiae bacterium]|nr:MAG: hypothetical protein E3J61_01415 [Candidatus Dependentiae bacterium]
MKKIVPTLLLFLFFMVQQVHARAILSGESLWSMQRLVTQASCDVTIRQIDLTGGVYTISTSGVYCLAENITGQIVIDTNTVVLDLNGKTVTNTTGNGIEVNGRLQVLIRNGSVMANNTGIFVASNSARIGLENVTIRNCVTGVEVDTTTNLSIDGCDIIATDTGMLLNNVSRATVNNTTASDATFVGFQLNGSNKSLFTNCHTLNIGQGLTDQTADVYGFFSSDGSSNIFRECVAQNTLALTVTGVPNVAASFALTGTESKSRITKCTSSIVETNFDGAAIPYGILLQYSFDLLETAINGNQGTVCNVVDWSPGGAFLATGGTTQGVNDEIQIFSFDRSTETLTTLTGASQGTECNAVAWFPDGTYLATAGADEATNEDIQIFSFDRATGLLNRTDAKGQGIAGQAVSWSPDGAYLATGGNTEGPNEIQIFAFDRVTGTLIKTGGASQGAECFAVAWSPDGDYLATGGLQQGTDEIQVFSFDHGTQTLTFVDGKSQGIVGGDRCRTVAWTSDGAFLATGGTPEAPPNNEIQVFSFDRTTETLLLVDSKDQGGECFAVAWSPDGAYLVTAGEPENGDQIQIFSFSRATETLTTFTGANQGTQGNALSWAPDGVYLATGGEPEGLNEFQIFKAFLFPLRNTISNNAVQAVSRSSLIKAGVGISGSSIENLITGNNVYNSAGFNYQFIPNVFDERFASIPTIAQNISIKPNPFFYIP